VTSLEALPDDHVVRVVIADDQPLMRTALRTILEADGIVVVGEAGDGDAAVAMCTSTERDAAAAVVLMDVRMPGRDGISATAELTRRSPATRVLVLTTFDDDDSLFGALGAGAAGFLLKNSTPEALQQAVRAIAAGDAVLDAGVVARVMQRFATADVPAAMPDDIARLTEREKDILSLLAEGASNVEVAARLGIGEATAKTHVSHVIFKLGVRDRVQAVIRAYQSGFAQQPRHLQRRHRDDERPAVEPRQPTPLT
jgi:DNA-binding NarL/FixJ family response regulator